MGTKVSSLSNVSSMASTDLIMVAQDAGGGTYTSKKATNSVVKSYVLGTGWADLIGDISIKGTGTATPAYEQIGATGFYSYAFVGTGAQLKEAFCNYHVLHDIKANGDWYIHTHWFPTDTGTGNVKWNFSVAYAKGYNRGNFNFASPTTVSVITAAPAVQYQHVISEVKFATNGGTGGILDSSTIETDGVFKVRIWRDPTDTDDTYGSTAYLVLSDIHYQKDHISTTNRNYPFE